MSNTITRHERPGVYSAYEASSFISGSTLGTAVGLCAICAGAEAGVISRVYDSEGAKSRFGAESLMCQMIELILKNGASEVRALPIASAAGYADAFAALGQEEGLPILLCDAGDLATQQALRAAVEESSALRRERIAVCAAAGGEDVEALIARAGALGSERVLLAAPAAEGEHGGARMAAAVAGAIAAESDPAVPLGGATLQGISELERSFGEEAIDLLIRGGVTPVERVGGACSVIRGITTRTKTGGVADASWRELSTIRIVDEVIPGIRNALRTRFPRSKNTAQVRSAIRSQVVLELEEKLRREIITGYSNVTASAVADDPSVCLVEFSFTVTHGLNQIWLSAKITV